MSEIQPALQAPIKLWNVPLLVKQGRLRSRRLSDAQSDVELISEWLVGKSPHTQRGYRKDLDYFLAFLYDRRKSIPTVTTTDIKAYYMALTTANKLDRRGLPTSEKLSPNTITRRMNGVRSLFKYALRVGILAENPCLALDRVSYQDKRGQRILTEGEVLTLIALEPSRRNQVLLRLLYDLGCRASELTGLTWGDFRELDDGSAIATILGKGNKVREVRLPKESWSDLQSVRGDKRSGDALFFSQRGTPLSHSQVGRIVKAAGERAKLDKSISPHWLRHCNASHSLQRGADLALVKNTLGHSNVSTTSGYLHAAPNDSTAFYLPR